MAKEIPEDPETQLALGLLWQCVSSKPLPDISGRSYTENWWDYNGFNH